MGSQLKQSAILLLFGIGLIATSSVSAAELAGSLGIGILAASIVLAIQLEKSSELLKFGWIILGALLCCILAVFLLRIFS